MADNNTTQSRALQRAQDYNLKELVLSAAHYNGKTYELRYIFKELKIQEDIFHGCITGEISLVDAVDLPQLLPLIGEEKIKVVFSKFKTGQPDSPEFPDYVMTFRVYNISQRKVDNTKVQTYTLYLVSEEFIKNFTIRLSRSFVNMPYSSMIDKAYNEKVRVSKPIVIEPTKGDKRYISPNITPFEMFNTLASQSVSSEGNGECYVFYEDKDQFNYVSLGKLLTQAVVNPNEPIIYRPKNLTFDSVTHTKKLAVERRNIEKYIYSKEFNILQNEATGLYASKAITIDLIRQKIGQVELDLDASFGTFKHLENNKYWTENLDTLHKPDSHVKYISTDTGQDSPDVPWISEKDSSIKSKNIEEYVLRRTSQLDQINTTRMLINIPGNPTMKVGQVIDVNLPQNLGKVSLQHPEQLDRYRSGRFLIISAMHTITLTSYNIHMEIAKDSYLSPIEHVDAFELYKDVK